MFIALKCVNTWQRWTEMCGNIPNKLHCLAAINDHNGNYCKHQGQAQKAWWLFAIRWDTAWKASRTGRCCSLKVIDIGKCIELTNKLSENDDDNDFNRIQSNTSHNSVLGSFFIKFARLWNTVGLSMWVKTSTGFHTSFPWTSQPWHPKSIRGSAPHPTSMTFEGQPWASPLPTLGWKCHKILHWWII